jgi:hypothetical protein
MKDFMDILSELDISDCLLFNQMWALYHIGTKSTISQKWCFQSKGTLDHGGSPDHIRSR